MKIIAYFFLLFFAINSITTLVYAQADDFDDENSLIEQQKQRDAEKAKREADNAFWETAWWEKCTSWDIILNISIPFVGRCIKKDPAARQTSDDRWNTTSWNVFPKLMGWLVRLLMTIIYIIWFLWILVWWFMITASGADPELKTKWRSLIKMVIWWLILVGLSGIILNFINPDFFSTASDATP
jgi:hypothetical protein